MTVDEFKEQEIAKMTWWDRAWRNYPEIKSTGSYASADLYSPLKGEQVFLPSLVEVIPIIIFLLFACRGFYALLTALVADNHNSVVTVFLLLLVTSIIVVLMWYCFLDPKRNFRIKIGPSGICIRGKDYSWLNIDKTYILKRYEGRMQNFYLVLFLKDAPFPLKFDFYRFSISYEKICAAIEYYKHLAQKN